MNFATSIKESLITLSCESRVPTFSAMPLLLVSSDLSSVFLSMEIFCISSISDDKEVVACLPVAARADSSEVISLFNSEILEETDSTSPPILAGSCRTSLAALSKLAVDKLIKLWK